VKVIPVPSHVQGYTQALRDCPFFERLTLSSEDQVKTKQYHEQRKRSELAQTAGSLEDFFRSLEQEVVIANVTPDSDRPRRATHAEDEPVQRNHAAL